MGLCLGTPHTVAVNVEELVLEQPYERDIVRNSPVVYLRQSDKLLSFTTVRPTCVGISAVWNQTRYLQLAKKDANVIEVVVGENPRYRGFIEDIREVSGELLVDIDEYEGTENLGNVAVLRVEVTQKYAAPDPPPMPERTFFRKGYEANLSVFLYEANGVDRRLVRGRKDSGRKNMFVDADLALHTPDDQVRAPTRVRVKSRHMKHGKKVGLVWNEGFHWQNLTEEPRFLDVRFNPGSEDESERATARVDLLHLDAWASGQDWSWHPILADDRRDQKFFRILVVDDTDSGPELERMLTVLSTDPMLEGDAEAALQMLCEDDYAMLTQFDMIVTNIRQKGGMDGITFAQKVRAAEQNAGLRPRVIVALDRPVQQSTRERDARILQTQGINDLLHKPFDKATVRWLLHRYLRNSGLVLLDMVVTYTPAGQKGVLGAYNATRARRLSARLKRSGVSQRLLTRARQGGRDEPLNGMLELRVLRAVLKDTVPENYNVTYIVTMNHQVLQARSVKRSKQGTIIAKGTPLEWDEDVHVWVSSSEFDGDPARRLHLGLAIYAYPAEHDTWHSDDLVGQWSNDEVPTFWDDVNGEYSSFNCALSKTSKKGKVRQKGHIEVRAIVRPAEEIARRQMHSAYARACDHRGDVSRGELARLRAGLLPLIHNEDEARAQRRRGRGVGGGRSDGSDDSEEDEDEEEEELDDDDDVAAGRVPPVVEQLRRFVEDSAHYSHNGQSNVDEATVMEMVDIKSSQIK